MTPITELDLPEVDIHDPALWRDPNPFVAAARAKHPWLAKSQFGIVLTDYQGVKDVLGMDDKCVTPNARVTALMNAEGTPWGRWNNDFMLAHSGQSHQRLRSLVASTFTPRNANLHRPIMRQVVSELLDEWVVKEQFDFTEFASYFPISVMCRLIGAPVEAVPAIKDALEVMGSGFDLDPSLTPKLNEAFLTLWNFVDGLVTERRAQSRSGDAAGEGDLLDALIAANVAGDKLDDTELYDLLILLFGGGYDTSKNLLGMLMHLLIDRPADWARVAEDQEFSRKVIEEALRHSSVVTTFRVVKEDFVYRDVLFPKDMMVLLPIPITGRDPDVFDNALAFDPLRNQEPRHFAFGRGAHLCLGQFLARAQIEEGLPIIAQRMRNPRRAGAERWRPFPGVWGISELPIACDAEARETVAA